MKKSLIFLFALLFLGSITAQAQLKYGLKAGVNLSSASFDASDLNPSNFTGFQVGPMIEFTVPIIGVGLDAAVLYSQQGFKLNDVTNRLNTLEVPLNLKYKFNLVLVGAYLTAGPYASFNLSDNLSNQWQSKTFASGLNFGFGVELLSRLQVGANYKLGLTDDFSRLVADVPSGVRVATGKQRGWTISAAYFF